MVIVGTPPEWLARDDSEGPSVAEYRPVDVNSSVAESELPAGADCAL